MTDDGQTAELRAHLVAIAARHEIEIIWLATRIGYAHKPERYVRIPHPTTPMRYFIGLHELGHCIAPRAWWGRVVEREAEAWQWAERQSLVPLSARSRAAIRGRLFRYLTNGPRWWGMRVPAPDSPFWNFYNAL